MAQTFEQFGLNYILVNGLENKPVTVVALASGVSKGSTNVNSGTVSGSTVPMGQAVINISETGITIDEIQIRIGGTVFWRNTGLSFAFPTTGTLTIDASFTLSASALTAAGRTALLKHGLSNKNGQLTTLGGSPVFQNFRYTAIVSNNALDLETPVSFNMPANYTFTGLQISVEFPLPTGTINFGSVFQSETFGPSGGTLTVSSLATSLTNN